MVKLEQTNHNYYFSSNSYDVFETWEDFKAFRGYDMTPFDEVLLVRYDLDNNKEMQLHFAGQRKGYTWTANIKNLKEEDMPEVNEFLNGSWNYLRGLWSEVSLGKDNNLVADNLEQITPRKR